MKQELMLGLRDRVAIVTGAGGGLGRAHALLLARCGAKVVVNDIGPAAQTVASEIVAEGGLAIAAVGSVTDEAQVGAMVAAAMAEWGRVDILVNNAGILRDVSFAKMTIDDLRAVIEVHVIGAAICSKAVWPIMREQQYGRIVMTTSSSGLYGNFGQANYGAAKMALVGLMQTLSIEGAKDNIRVNCLAPTAATAMTEGLLTEEMKALLVPESVSPGLVKLVSEDAPTRAILCAGAGHFKRAYVTLTAGRYIGQDPDATSQVDAHWDEISDRTGEIVPESAVAQITLELTGAMGAATVKN